MADAFISYVRADRSIAEQISRALEATGFSVWWDRELHGGEDFSSKIEQEITAAKTVVVLWSAVSQQSKWVRDEAAFARDANKLVPLRLDETEPPLGFRQIQAIDFQHWTGDPASSPFESLLVSLRRYINGAPPPSTADVKTAAPASLRRAPSRRMLIASAAMIAVVAVVALLWFGPGAGVRDPESSNDGRIEVGVFEPLTRSEELDRFARASAATVVRVMSTNGIQTVVRDFNDSEVRGASGSIGPELTLHGRVDREGNELVVNANVINRRDRLALWSISMRRDATQVGLLQDQFSFAVAYTLRCALHFRASAGGNPSTGLFAQFLGLCEAFRSDLEQTPELTARLVATAPQYAVSFALQAVANAYVSNQPTLRGVRRPPEEIARLRQVVYDAAAIAKRLDPKFDPFLARALVVDPAVDLVQREQFFREGLAGEDFAPPSLLTWYGTFLESVGRVRDARVTYGRAVKEGPLDQRWRLQSAFLAAWLGDIEAARYEFDDMRGKVFDFDIDASRLWTEMWFGDGAIAKAVHERVKVEGARRFNVPACMAFFVDVRATNRTPSEAEIERACGRDNDIVFAYFGYVDAAFRGLDAYRKADSGIPGFADLFMPHMRNVRADSRFMSAAKRLGLVDYWLDTDQWPDFCNDEELPYDCKEAALAESATEPVVNAPR